MKKQPLLKKVKIQLSETLKCLNIGEEIVIKNYDAKTQSIRNTAKRITDKLSFVYEITEKGLVSETKIKRIK